MNQENIRNPRKEISTDLFEVLYEDSLFQSMASYVNEDVSLIRLKYPKLLSLLFSSITKEILDNKIKLRDLFISDEVNPKVAYLNKLSRHSDRGTLFLQRLFSKSLPANIKNISEKTRLSEETVFSLAAIVTSILLDNLEVNFNIKDDNFSILNSLVSISLKSKYLDEDGFNKPEKKFYLGYLQNASLIFLILIAAFSYYLIREKYELKDKNNILGDSPLDEIVFEVDKNNKALNKIIFSK